MNPDELSEQLPTPSASRDRVNIFVDAENASSLRAGALDRILARAKELGELRVRKAYADWGRMGNDMQRQLSQRGFHLEHAWHPVKGKDSADILMIVDVMDCLIDRSGRQIFILVTGDSDYTPLFKKLHEREHYIVGCVPGKVLRTQVQEFCHEFIELETPAGKAKKPSPAPLPPTPPAPPPKPAKPPPPPRAAQGAVPDEWLQPLREALGQVKGEVNVSRLQSAFESIIKQPDYKQHGFRSFAKLVEKVPDLVRIRRLKGGNMLVSSAEAPEPAASVEPPEPAERQPPAPRPQRESPASTLRQIGWVRASGDVVLAARSALAGEPLTRGQLFRRAKERNPSVPEGRVKDVFVLLLKAGLMSSHPNPDQTTSYAVANPDQSADSVFEAIDKAMLARLVGRYRSRGLSLSSADVRPLLLGTYDDARIEQLLASPSSFPSTAPVAEEAVPPAEAPAPAEVSALAIEAPAPAEPEAEPEEAAPKKKRATKKAPAKKATAKPTKPAAKPAKPAAKPAKPAAKKAPAKKAGAQKPAKKR